MFRVFEDIIAQKGLSIYRVAKDTEIPISNFYEWKKNNFIPRSDMLYKIAKFLGVPMETFFEFVEAL